MPFYEYECQSCKYYAEVMQKISDAPLTKCPSCGKRTMKKLVSVPVFRLKGSGWYETDFKSDKENKRNLVGADKEEAKADAKTDTKTDTKTEAKESTATSAEKKEPKESKEAKSPAAADSAERPARRRVTVPVKSARPAARHATRGRKRATKRRR